MEDIRADLTQFVTIFPPLKLTIKTEQWTGSILFMIFAYFLHPGNQMASFVWNTGKSASFHELELSIRIQIFFFVPFFLQKTGAGIGYATYI
jgi:hypothetical protein